MKDAIEEGTKDGYKWFVIQDTEPNNPREDSETCLGTMVCFHKRYDLGDKHTFESPEELAEFLEGKDVISLPLYLYDHSVLHMSTESFRGRAQHAEWDSGQVGYIYTTKERALEFFGEKVSAKEVLEVLTLEVNMYDKWGSGQVYGYVIEDKDGEVVESCGGYYDMDNAEKDALMTINALPCQYELKGVL